MEQNRVITEEPANDTYESNSYYDVVETSVFKNSIGSTEIIDKVLTKQTGGLEATMIVYSPDGKVIGKYSDDIFVTEGKYNYFRYSFDADVSNAKFDKTVRTTSSIFDADINAVEMVDYNQSEDDLYIIAARHILS